MFYIYFIVFEYVCAMHFLFVFIYFLLYFFHSFQSESYEDPWHFKDSCMCTAYIFTLFFYMPCAYSRRARWRGRISFWTSLSCSGVVLGVTVSWTVICPAGLLWLSLQSGHRAADFSIASVSAGTWHASLQRATGLSLTKLCAHETHSHPHSYSLRHWLYLSADFLWCWAFIYLSWKWTRSEWSSK